MMPYDVCIATSTYFGIYGNVTDPNYRKGLFLQLRDSIKHIQTAGAKICWLVQDDASPEPFPEWADDLPFEMRTVRRKEHIGMPENYLSTVESACTLADWILIADDDSIFQPPCGPRIDRVVVVEHVVPPHREIADQTPLDWMCGRVR